MAWQIAALVASGKFLEAVYFDKSPLTAILKELKEEVDGKVTDAHEIVLKLRDLIEDYLSMGAATPEKHLALVYSAVASLMVFVQGNFTGPPFEGEVSPSPVRPILPLIAILLTHVFRSRQTLAPFFLISSDTLWTWTQISATFHLNLIHPFLAPI